MAVKLINRLFNSLAELFVKDGNLRVDGNAYAKVNEIDDIELGLPIGSIIIWSGDINSFYKGLPKNWFACDGSKIDLYDSNRYVNKNADCVSIRDQYIQNIHFAKDDLQSFVDILSSKYGNGTPYYVYEGDEFNGYYLAYGLADPDDHSYSYYLTDTTDNRVERVLTASEFSTVLQDVNYNHQIQSSKGDYDLHYFIKLPDLNGRFPIGVGIGTDVNSEAKIFNLGSRGGEYNHTLTASESGLPQHSHTFDADYGGDDEVLDPHIQNTVHDTNGTKGYVSTNNAGPLNASQSHNNIPPYLAVNYIIKYA